MGKKRFSNSRTKKRWKLSSEAQTLVRGLGAELAESYELYTKTRRDGSHVQRVG
jgi:hypothetical protein